jgi:hypothetical protein
MFASDVLVFESKGERIAGVYKPFNLKQGQTRAQSDENFFKCLPNCSQTGKNSWIRGDFNINLVKKTNDYNKLIKWQDDHSLNQLVTSYTWFRIHTRQDGKKEHTKSLIGHVYTNCDNATIKLDDKWTSDRCLIIFKLPEREKIK